ncbi:hypothetical protein ILUMI_05074 [Ignelater luminosus]|uniref:Uncharacterized protein n=1 Tax=Ignelater luminosus TaxID=2038154 RepID=A0A8K0GIZ9_IGNLU|nr:hypothetical protein ILUMI_05074 [Ignelater luminosus]
MMKMNKLGLLGLLVPFLLTSQLVASLSEVCFYHNTIADGDYIQCGNIKVIKNTGKQEELSQISNIQIGWNTSLPVLEYGLFNAFEKLSSLFLNNANIEEIESRAFFNMEHLQELSLYNNKISRIELGTFNHLNRLRILNLGQNQIQSLKEYTFSNLQHLEQLILRWNNIGEVTKTTFNGLSKLKVLDLTGNRLKILHSETFEGLRRVKSLDLSFNELKEISPDMFSNQKDLVILNLESNAVNNLPDGLFENTINLENLDVSNNKLTHLEETLLKNTVVEILKFNRNYITRINATKLLFNADYLDEIYFDFNPWNCNSLRNLVRELQQSLVQFGTGTKYDSKYNVHGIECSN